MRTNSDHKFRQSFRKFALAGQHNGGMYAKQLKQSQRDKDRYHRQVNRAFAMAPSGANIPFSPAHCLSAARRKTNKFGDNVGSQMRVIFAGGTLVKGGRPWRGKSERRQVLRNRREDKAAALANLQK